MNQIVRQPIAATVTSIVAEKLRPLVQRIDADGYYPAQVLRDLGGAAAYAHHTATLGRGPEGLTPAIEAMAEVGASCMSTAFCMWCQDALVWYLDRADNPAPQSKYLQAVASGHVLGGTGLSNPMKAFAGFEPFALRGRRVAGGYRVSGRLPFVSNIEDGHLFASIFAIEDTNERYAMAVFAAGSDGVKLAHNAHFIALEGTATVSVLIRDAFVPGDDVLSDDAAPFVQRIRKGFVLLQAGMALGVARGASQLMRHDGPAGRAAQHLPLGPDGIDARAAQLTERIAAHIADVEEPDRASFLAVLRTRLDLTWLALEAAQAAVLQYGARGYLTGAEPARRLREAQFVAIVTPSVKHITTELAKDQSGID
jgi:alkylation response protein AidB-like acyl-CoA dehydrogenase